jgi:hypothetical protein
MQIVIDPTGGKFIALVSEGSERTVMGDMTITGRRFTAGESH